MATANDVIHRALRLLGVIAVEETPSSSEVNDALSAFNEMLASWDLEGITLGFDDVTLTQDLNEPADHIRAFAYNLAMEIANEYGVEPAQATVKIAEESRRAIRRAYTKPHKLRVPNDLQQVYRRRYYNEH